MAKIEFIVLGVPKAQARHRHTSAGKFVRTYDPTATEKQDFAVVVQQYAPPTPFTGPISVSWTAYFPRPKSHYRTGKYAGQLKDNAPVWHITRPDRDNVDKFILDALSGIFWKNDSQVCDGPLSKRYSVRPQLVIRIETLAD